MKNDFTSLFTTLIKAMVSLSEEVKIEQSEDEMGVLLRISVATEDRGKIIGKQGATAESLRTIARTVGGVARAKISLIIES